MAVPFLSVRARRKEMAPRGTPRPPRADAAPPGLYPIPLPNTSMPGRRAAYGFRTVSVPMLSILSGNPLIPFRSEEGPALRHSQSAAAVKKRFFSAADPPEGKIRAPVRSITTKQEPQNARFLQLITGFTISPASPACRAHSKLSAQIFRSIPVKKAERKFPCADGRKSFPTFG